MVGINATTDIDNGTLVTLTKIAKTEAGDITGYQYEVAPAALNSVNVWLVATPEIGKTLEMQVHDDIRYFYNKAGLPMDIFQKANNNVYINYGSYNIHQTNVSDYNRLILTVRYNFNTTRSKYKGTGAGQDAISRIGSK